MGSSKQLAGKIIKYEIVDNNGERVIVTDVSLPDDVPARMKTLRAEGKKWYLTVAYLPDSEEPFALFCSTNHNEKSAQTSDAVERLVALARRKGILEDHVIDLIKKIEHDNNVSKLTRTISLLLRHKVSIKNIVSELNQMQDVFVGSFLFQIKKFLSQYIKEGEKAEGVKCEACGSTNVVFSEGCFMCKDCNSTKCG
jgi:translation initiation factor 2 beta subunit (eIF-2beta)/eIF-5